MNFLRKLWRHSSAHLNQQVVIAGGLDGQGYHRDEVFFGIFQTKCTEFFFVLQVLQYNATADKWTLVEKMQFRRYDLVVVEANLGDDCAALGNLYPGKKEVTIINLLGRLFCELAPD